METATPAASTRGAHSQALDLLRFPLAVIVVLIHVFPIPGYGEFKIGSHIFQSGDYPAFYGLLNFIDSFLRGQSVPVYFFISGYVFFYGVELTKEKYLQKLKNRVKTLLIPYFVWNTLALLVLMAMNMLPLSFLAPYADPFNPSLHGFLSAYWGYDGSLFVTGKVPDGAVAGPINGLLWFIRDLMIVVLFTPVIYKLIKKYGKYPLIALGAVWFASEFNDMLNYKGFATAFFFFSWGAYMSICKKDMIAEFGKYFKLSVVMFFVLGVLGMIVLQVCPEAASGVKKLNIIVGLSFAYNLAARIIGGGRFRANEFLIASSFFVYVSHMIICGRIRDLLYNTFKPGTDAGMIVLHLGALAMTMTIILTAFWTLRRFMPGLLRIMTGRR